MQSPDDIKIVCVPPDRLPDVWHLVGGMLLRAQLASSTTADDAIDKVVMGIRAIADGTAQLWMVTAENPPRVVSAWVTQIHQDEDGDRTVGIYVMSGMNARKWMQEVSAAMAEFAKAEKCRAVVFWGRKAWGRLLPEFKRVDTRDDGAALFERAV